jgi:two-component system cell cycle response regulator DivK
VTDNNKKILIVEDNEINAKLYIGLFESEGYTIVHSAHGLDTLDLAREHDPDAIILDIQLPEVSGLEHARNLKADEQLKHIPIIAVTAFAMKGDEERIMESGCDAYLAKPVPTSVLLETVAKYTN